MSSGNSDIFAIDLHSDYLSCKSNCVTSPKRIKSSRLRVQFFAIFLPPERKYKNYLMEELGRFREIIKHNGFVHGKTPELIINAFRRGDFVAVPAVEDAEILDILGDKDWAVSLGVRYVTIVHNHSNRYGGSSKDGGGGLSPLGRKLLRWLEGRRILPDVSHSSEKTFKDILSHTRGPVIASHSCVYTVNLHYRNLKDYQIKEIAGTGGVIGINFYPRFLCGQPSCGIEKVVEHIQYISDLVGVDYVALGSDFDGIPTYPDGLNGPEGLEKLMEKLQSSGFSLEEIKKIFSENIIRVLGN